MKPSSTAVCAGEKVVLCGLVLFFFAFTNGRFSVPFATAFAWGVSALFVQPLRRGLPLLLLAPLLLCTWGGVAIAMWGMAPKVSLNLGLSFAVSIFHVIIALVDSLARSGLCRSRTLQLLALPFAAVAVLQLFVFVSPYGSLGLPGTELAYQEPLAQLMAATGLPGVFFLNGWIASVIALVPWRVLLPKQWRVAVCGSSNEHVSKSERRWALKNAALLLAFLVGLYFFGGMALTFDPANSAYSTPGWIRVGGVFTNTTAQYAKFGKRQPTEHFQMTLNETRLTARDGAQIVVWNEWGIIVETWPRDDYSANPCASRYCELLREVGSIAAEENVFVAANFLLDFWSGPEDNHTVLWTQNAILFFNRSGEVLWTYAKRYPVFGAENGVEPGDGRIKWSDTEFGRISAIVCADAGYPQLVSQTGRNKIDLLLVPSEDWAPLYRSITPSMMLRAVENGVAIFRLTAYGKTAGVSSRGSTIFVNSVFLSSTTTSISHF